MILGRENFLKIYFDILDARDVSDDEAAQAHEMLVHNAQNLMRYVKEVTIIHRRKTFALVSLSFFLIDFIN